MILFAAIVIGVADMSLAFPERNCNSASRLELAFRLNRQEVPRSSFSERMRLLTIDIEEILNKDDFLFLLGDMCESRRLTFNWLFREIDRICPQSSTIRSHLTPTGAVCNPNGTVSDLTRTALRTFVRVDKSCTPDYTEILNNCETDARFGGVDVPLFPEQTLETDIIESTMINTAAIRCALNALGALSPRCVSIEDLKAYTIVSELITRQPFDLSGNVSFQTFAEPAMA